VRSIPSSLGAIIIAGGKSSRLKVNKAFLKIRSEPLISEVVRVTSAMTKNIIVSIGSQDQEEKFADVLPSWVKIVKDTKDEKAALYGIFTGLRFIETDYAAVLAVDLPFVNIEVIRMLHREAEGYDLALPAWPNGDIEPTYAVYRVSTSRKAFHDAIEADGIRIVHAINRLGKINYVHVEQIQSVDRSLHCFINVNTKADLEKVKKILHN
jgi:molybdopterin-guanine dinucleotide biosynthesis protein A